MINRYVKRPFADSSQQRVERHVDGSQTSQAGERAGLEGGNLVAAQGQPCNVLTGGPVERGIPTERCEASVAQVNVGLSGAVEGRYGIGWWDVINRTLLASDRAHRGDTEVYVQQQVAQ